ncbi:2,5-diamino-6-(ribosylamino)-4(3H)-pyrimidinone 5'-phosphate reductase [Thoreauomyces humboldtii]|nr:2,5-diamino-6-(ribosylamino)-4(3H)-pyrimidinone 5'-phosphate reductase [Thoreauomyces humboldtii]
MEQREPPPSPSPPPPSQGPSLPQPSAEETTAHAFLTSHLPFPTTQDPTSPCFLTLTYAQSLDAFIAGPDRRPLTLSSHPSMVLTHALRSSHDAIVVGVDTIINDDPSLTTRLVVNDPWGRPAKSPRPVVLDSRLRMPLNAKILDIDRGQNGGAVVVVTTDVHHDPVRKKALEERGAVVLVVESDGNGRVRLSDMLRALRERGLRSVMVEGGAKVIRSFLVSDDQVHIDLLVVTVAPVLIGSGIHALGGEQVAADSTVRSRSPPPLVGVHWKQFGPDVVMLTRTASRNANVE